MKTIGTCKRLAALRASFSHHLGGIKLRVQKAKKWAVALKTEDGAKGNEKLLDVEGGKKEGGRRRRPTNEI